jgi:hypothetical protein
MSQKLPYQHKRSSVAGKVPLAADIQTGEIALNMTDKKLFTKDGSNAIITLSEPFFKYTREFHVDPVNGSDTNNGGEFKPFLTIAAALTAAGNIGSSVILHPGTYTEDVTFTNLNVDVIARTGGGGIVNCSGTWTINHASGSARFSGISFTGLMTISTSGSVYIRGGLATGGINKTGSGYVYLEGVDTQGANLINATGSGTVSFMGGLQGAIVANNASAVVSIQGSSSCIVPTNTLGTMVVIDTNIYSVTANSNAISAAAGSATYLYNSRVISSAGVTGRVSFPTGAFYSVNNTVIDRANSTLTGTNLGTVSQSDAIQVGALTATGLVTLGNVANVKISGGSNGQFLQTNGNGNLVWANGGSGGTGTAIVNGNSNVSIDTANGNITMSVANVANVVTVSNANVRVSGTMIANSDVGVPFSAFRYANSPQRSMYNTGGARGTKAAPLPLQVNDFIGGFTFQTYIGNSIGNVMGPVTSDGITGWANSSFAPTVNGILLGLPPTANDLPNAGIQFTATNSDGTSRTMRHDHTGNISLYLGTGGGIGYSATYGATTTSNIQFTASNIALSTGNVANIMVVRGSNTANANANTTTTVANVNIPGIATFLSNTVANSNSNTTTTTASLTLAANTRLAFANVANVPTANLANAYYSLVVDNQGVVSREPIVAALQPVLDNTLATPPGTPVQDDSYIVAATATGAWLGQENKIATWSGSAWVFYSPNNNDSTTVTGGTNAGSVYVYDSATTTWVLKTVTTPISVSNWQLSAAYTSGSVVINGNDLYQANGPVTANTAFTVGTTGATWKTLSRGSLTAEYGEVVLGGGNNAAITSITTSQATANTVVSFTLPSAGVWEVQSIVRGYQDQAVTNNGINFGIFDASNTLVANSEGKVIYWNSSGSTFTASGTQVSRITTTGAGTYTLKAWRDGSQGGPVIVSDTAGRTKVTWKKISGFLPATGAMAQYSSVSFNQSTPQNNDIKGTVVSGQGIAYNTSTGVYTLTGGITYKFDAFVTVDGSTGTGDASFFFVDATTNATFGTEMTTIATNYASRPLGRNGSTSFIYTPSSNQTVKLRCLYAEATYTYKGAITITQIGTTNTSAFTGVISNAWNINNTYPSGSIVANGGMLFQANSLILAGTAWTLGTSGATWSPIGAAQAEYGESILSATMALTSGVTADVVSFTLPSAGVWEVDYSVRGVGTGGSYVVALITDNSNTEVANSRVLASPVGGQSTGDMVVRITTTGSTTYKLRAVAGGGNANVFSDTNGITRLSWKKISGFVPVTGRVTRSRILDRVAATARGGDTTVNEWSATYTSTGGAFEIRVDPQMYANTTGARVYYLLRDGVVVDTVNYFFNNSGVHTGVTPLYWNATSETGTHTYAVRIGTGLSVDSNDRCLMVVTETF